MWGLLLLVGVVSADIGLGYHYKVPETSYGVPSYQIGGNSGQYNSAYSSGFGSESGYQNIGLQSGSSSGLGSGYYQSTSSSGNVQPTYQYSGNSGLGTGFQTQYSASSQFLSQGQEKYQQNYQIQQQPTQVFKHFYVHAAPEEPEPPKVRTPIVLPPAQKHYKIIFVKTPTENYRSQSVVPVQPQNEEKTIVYVLVKKPEDQHEVIVPKIEQKPPSKPEVYFIKYKNKEDSQAVINNIVKDYNKGDVSILNAGTGETTFNSVSGAGDASYNTASGFGNVNYVAPAKTEVTSGSTSFGSSGFGNVNYVAPVKSEVSSGSTSFGSSGFGNVNYVAPVTSEVSSGSTSFGTQGSSFSLASANSGANLSEAQISSTITPAVTLSSTASTYDFEGASAISTSQGVPHETYGPPKFRVN